ncbi:putative methyltransferase [Clostridium sporogenes]|jgi:predicted methyltransferase|uniref:bis-aminopropyl spermidine synthase family protein n=1 Tax=Clostridium sporogenes TaxID=1509 RepID=UPI0002FDC80F|nr:bis-aminopropyl spermidine synthase family protein [Clostridium sporogenes]NFE65561.1 putative methyltransferase [Clostridium sporogenes]NFG95720.1 putative methyltransferase [Clostridium sporogenes]NFH33530.1 putative methyltransferase [Clostridium sporogenes]NFL19370.1 putative methyltransferase [Clostridium sporogenes]NFL76145.1 putative methyltransferase [Clostridium sporogenes]
MRNDYVDIIYQNVKIQEGRQAIEKLLIDFYFARGYSSKDYAVLNNIPVPLVTAIKNEALKLKLLEKSAGIHLSLKGKQFVENELGYRGINVKLYKTLNISNADKIKERLSLNLNNIFENRPKADVSVDQSKCTLETAIKRALLCLENNCLIGKNILCVGDDDLISVSIGMLLHTLYSGNMNLCKTKIYVLDSDQRILDYICEIAKLYDLPVNCYNIDFRDSIPNEYISKMDCLYTDPPYTLSGMKLFLSRGLECLKNSVSLNVFLSYAHKSQEEMLKIHKIFIELGLSALRIMPKFNRYEGAGILGNSSQMFLLKTTAAARSPIIGEKFNIPIYTGEIKKTRRKYGCKNCNTIHYVSLEDTYSTIEELKTAGCTICGHHFFNMVSKKKMLNGDKESYK